MTTKGRVLVLMATLAASSGAVLSGTTIGEASATTPTSQPATSSSFQAGYVVVPSNGVASGSTTFRVPSTNCTGSPTGVVEFGVESNANGGFANSTSVVKMYCNGTTPVYKFIVQANATEFIEPGVNPGDLVVASFFETSSLVEAVVHDLNSRFTWVADGSPLPAADVSIGAVVAPGEPPIVPFSTTSFTKSEVNGDYIGFQSYIQYSQHQSHLMIQTGALTDGGDTFKLVFKNIGP